jgi:hypothetical protein
MHEQEKFDLLHAVADRLGMKDEPPVLVEFPSLTRAVVRLSKVRREQLRHHLESIVDESPEVEREDGDEQARLTEPLEVENSLCSKCRGHCCRNGGNKAYLTAETLHGVLVDRADEDVQTVIDSYVACVPKTGYVGSCIYHSPRGCALPRTMRSATCNKYVCGAINQLLSIAEQGQTALAITTAAHPIRALMVREGEVQELRPHRWKSAEKGDESLSVAE